LESARMFGKHLGFGDDLWECGVMIAKLYQWTNLDEKLIALPDTLKNTKCGMVHETLGGMKLESARAFDKLLGFGDDFWEWGVMMANLFHWTNLNEKLKAPPDTFKRTRCRGVQVSEGSDEVGASKT